DLISFSIFHSFLSLRPLPSISTLFPYTTLFRSFILVSFHFLSRVRMQTKFVTEPISFERTWNIPTKMVIYCLMSTVRSDVKGSRSEEHTSELQSLRHLVCRLLLEKKKKNKQYII